MKAILFFVVSSFSFTCFSQQSVYDQLVSVNKQWEFQADANPALKTKLAQPLPEMQLIQLHLRETEKLLKGRSVAHLDRSQTQNREKLLNVLHEYRVQGEFPKNTFHTERQPYFIDIFNTYCAVGFLMKQSGADKMAREISASQNFSYLKDINHPGLGDWQESSGFTVDELALIQPGYDCYATSVVEMHYNNSGPDVNEYIEFIQAAPFVNAYYGMVTRIEFYDNTNTLYKTVPIEATQGFGAGIHFGGFTQTHFRYYVFPVNESFADEGVVKFINTTAAVDRNVMVVTYSGSGTTINYYNVFSGPSLGQISHSLNTSLGQNGTTAPGISLNFCSPGCTAGGMGNYFPDLLPQTIGTANLNCLRILPVNLKSFNYSLVERKVQLTWETASEINTDRFEIERSTDGINFSRIGSVNAAVNSSVSKFYNFLDPLPATTNYYRLKQTDRDGKSVYSKILLVKLKVNSPLVLYSPLATDILRVGINLNQQEIQALKLYDISGRVQMGFISKAGLNEINISRLTPGSYFLRLETKKGENFGERFIKQ